MKAFLSADVPLCALLSVPFVLFGGFLGWPGTVAPNAPGAAAGGVPWGGVMRLNPLVVAVSAFPFLQRFPK